MLAFLLTLAVVEKVYEAWLVARVKKPAETVLKFSRRWGRLYEGTRIEDTKFIIATIKQVEAELAARDTLNPKTKSKSKKRERARFPEVVDATAAVSAPDPVPNADSKSPARKRTKQSSISEEASASEDTTNKLAVKKPDVSEQHSPEFLADAFEEPATISKTSPSRNVAPIETNTSLGLPKPTSLKDTAPPLTQNSRASGRRPAAQYITVGEPTMTQEIDEEGRTIITYDHSQQRTYRVMSGSLIGAPSESEIAPKAVRNPDPTKNAPKGPRADDHYRPNYLPGYQPNYQSGYGTRREHRR